MYFQKNLVCSKSNLHKRHEQFPKFYNGFQSLLFDLQMAMSSESFIFCGTRSNIFGPKYAIVSDPQ